ncbi:MAG: hypothetical protein AB2L07_13680 [Thermoanaerobaculaceae bacterium]
MLRDDQLLPWHGTSTPDTVSAILVRTRLKPPAITVVAPVE